MNALNYSVETAQAVLLAVCRNLSVVVVDMDELQRRQSLAVLEAAAIAYSEAVLKEEGYE